MKQEENTNVPGSGTLSEVTARIRELVPFAPSGDEIVAQCERVFASLVEEYYTAKGTSSIVSVWKPATIFSKVPLEEQLYAVVDDDLGRMNRNLVRDEDKPRFVRQLTMKLVLVLAANAPSEQVGSEDGGCGGTCECSCDCGETFCECGGNESCQCDSSAADGTGGISLKSVDWVVKNLELLLLEKNISYHNSALNPVSIFGELSAEDQLYSRLNDKLNRIKNAQNYQGEGFLDAVHDTCGYLVLLALTLPWSDEDDYWRL